MAIKMAVCIGIVGFNVPLVTLKKMAVSMHSSFTSFMRMMMMIMMTMKMTEFKHKLAGERLWFHHKIELS